MAETYIQVSPDGSGKRVAANTDADGNYRQVIEIGDGGGTDLYAIVTAAGALKTDASATTQPVSGTVTADQGGSWTVTADQGGSWTVTSDQGGTWTVDLATAAKGTTAAGNPTSENVDVNTQALHVALAASAVTLAVSGTVTADQGGSWTVAATQSGGWTVTADQGGTWQVELTDGTNVIGTATHPVRTDPTGTTTQPVSGTFWQATQPVSGTVAVSSVGGTVAVSGTVTADQGSPPWDVNIPTGTPTIGQAKIAVGGTAVQIHSASAALAQGVAVLALGTNVGDITVGPSGVTDVTDGTGNGWVLVPGQGTPVLPYSNINQIYINGANVGDGICFVGI